MKTDENNVCMHVLHTIIDSIQVEAELAYAHILSRGTVPDFRHLNKSSRSLSTTLKPSSFE